MPPTFWGDVRFILTLMAACAVFMLFVMHVFP